MRGQAFVARERELARLGGFLDHALAGQGQVCFVVGEAGRGKTALVTEFARQAQERRRDLVVAVGQGDAETGVGDPYLPFREVLSQLTGDIEAGAITQENAGRLRNCLRLSGQVLMEVGPDLIGIFVPAAGLAMRMGAFLAERAGWLERLEQLARRPRESIAPGSLGIEQSHIFEQYTDVLRALAARVPLMLVLDDLQWADAASIRLLFRLGRRIGGSRVLIVSTYRPDEVALGRVGERHPLDKVLAEFKRYFGDVWIDLERAEEAEGRRFVDDLLDTEPNLLGEEFRRALYRHTGGHPLFTVELLRDLQERGATIQDGQGRWIEGPVLNWGALPARVEGVIEERIGRLDGELREALTVASVEGEAFTAEVVARVQATDARALIRRLSRELEGQHRLVDAQGIRRVGVQRLSLYRFRHNLFQGYLYNSLDEVERAYLHEDVGRVLEELYGDGVDEIAVQLAYHWERAGEPVKAVEYLLRAGDQAHMAYAYEEAVDYYQRALPLLKEQGNYAQAAQTLMRLGLIYHLACDFERARRAYDEGFSLWQRVSETQSAARPAAAPHALRVDWSGPTTLDPGLAGDLTSSMVIARLFSGLVELSPELDVVPDMARRWEVSEGGRKYVFHLRDDVRWSDGVPVTARDFEYAWGRVLDPATGSPKASLLYDVKGARAFHRGESGAGDVGVRALDDSMLVVELEEPTGYFLHLLANWACYPVPRHVVEARGKAWTEAGNIVTNGPFRLEAWRPGQPMVFARNPDYHRQPLCRGNVQRVELPLLPIDEWSARLAMYEADELDVLSLFGLPPGEKDRVRQRHAEEYVSVPVLSTWYVGFDVSRPPFDDPRVRRAFVLATDRKVLADVVLRGYRSPATGGFVPPGMPAHSPGIAPPYNPVQARRLLAEAGYPGGESFPVVNLLAWQGSEPHTRYLQAQWQENLRVEVTWEVGQAVSLDRLREGPPHMSLATWIAGYPDPDDFLSGGVSNVRRATRWRDDAYDRLVETAKRVADQGERIKMYQQADRILVEEAIIMPLVYGQLHLLVKPWVSKFPTSALKWWFWKDVVIEPH